MKILKQKKFWLEHYHDEKYETIRNKIVNTFNELIFEEGPHKYYLHGKEITCVSNVTHMFKPHFDVDSMAQATYDRNYDNPNSKYYQMGVEQIKESWKKISNDACSHGTERHLFAECIQYFMSGEFDKIADEFKDRLQYDSETGEPIFIAKEPKEIAAAQFYEDMPECIIPILAETKVYREDLGYSGTFDLLCYYDAPLNGKDDSQSGLLVLDWKTNRDLYKNFKEQKLLEPFDELLDMPLSIYKLQLSLYALALEYIGFNVVGRRIMWLKPNGVYEKINLESYTKILEDYLKTHKIE